MSLEPGQQYKINLRSMSLFNVFMTVPNDITFKYCLPGATWDYIVPTPLTITSISIPAGNYTGYTLATLLTNGTTRWASFDISTSKIKFWSNAAMTTPLLIVPVYTAGTVQIDAWQILGFYKYYYYHAGTGSGTVPAIGLSQSQVPINLTGATQIQLWTNLSVYNIPGSGRLASIPMSVNYNELLQYEDQSGAQPRLISDGNIQSIRICLKDEHSVPLADQYLPSAFGPGTYEHDNFSPPWEVVLSIERVGPSQQHSYSYVPQ